MRRREKLIFTRAVVNRALRRGTPILGVLVALLAVAPVAPADDALIGALGTPAGEGNGRLHSPTGVAVNRTGAGGVSPGDVYVVDSANNRIEQFSATSAFVRTFGYDVVASGPDNTGLNEKQSLTVDATGGTFELTISREEHATTTAGSNIVTHPYVPLSAFHVGDSVQGPFPAGTTVTAVGTESLVLSAEATATQGFFEVRENIASIPYNVTREGLEGLLEALPAIGAGNVAVAEGAGGSLTIEYKGTLAHDHVYGGGHGVGVGGFISVDSTALTGASHTAAIVTTVAGGGYEVCDASASNDVCKAGPPCNTGEEAPADCGVAMGAGAFDEPSGITVDQGNGNVYVVDAGQNLNNSNNRIDVYSATGAFEGAFGWDVNASSPKEELQFCTVVTGCQRGTSGGGSGQLGALGRMGSRPALGPNGDLYLPDGGNSRLDEFAPALNGSEEVIGASFVRAFGWDVTESGPDNIVAVNAVQQLTIPSTITGGSFTLSFAGQTTGALPYNVVKGALSNALNKLASVAGVGGSIQVVAKGTGVWELIFADQLEEVPVPQIGVDNSQLSGGGASVAVLAEGVSPEEVCDVAVHPTDVCKPGLEGNHLGQFEAGAPTSVAVDSSGAIYVIDVPSNGCAIILTCRLLEFGSSGESAEEFAHGQLTRTEGQVSAAAPIDVAVDPSKDHVLVSKRQGQETYKVLEFDSSGSLLAESPGQGRVLASGVDSSQHGLAVGIGGRFYLNNALGMIDIFGPPPAPAVSIEAVTGIGASSATFHGTVTPPAAGAEGERFDTTYHFEYSLDGVHWSRFPAEEVDIGDGSGAGSPDGCPVGNPPTCDVSQTVTGLRPHTHYEVRLVATTGTPSDSPSEGFDTEPASPSVSGLPAEQVTQGSATLAGIVNPNNEAGTYRFQWGTSTAYGNQTPLVSTGSGGEDEKVVAPLSGLQPGVVYHYRLLATNPSGTTEGPDREFVTLDSFSLPDGRAPEQVSPVEKRPVGRVGRLLANQIHFQASTDGEGILYPLLNGLADATAGGDLDYLAERGEAGWRSSQVTPQSLVPSVETEIDSTGNVRYASPDLSCQLLETFEPLSADTSPVDVEQGIRNLYLRDTTGTDTLLSTPVPLNGNEIDHSVPAYHVDWASRDCSHVLFDTPYRLSLAAPSSGDGLYVWADGVLRPVGVLPDGSPATGALAGAGWSVTNFNSMSTDGSRVFFTATSDEGGDNRKQAIFVRENGTDENADTVDASQSQTAKIDEHPSYQMASADGSHVFFTAGYGLAANATSAGAASCQEDGTGCDLYSYDVDTEALTDLSADGNPADAKGAGVVGVVDASEDGSYVYFAARGQLAAGQGDSEANNLQDASYNVYLSHGGAVSYVGAIDAAESARNGSVGGLDIAGAKLAGWVADATPDGAHLLFVSKANVTGYDSGGVAEAYLYSAASGQTVCVSCRGDGHTANGNADTRPIAAEAEEGTLVPVAEEYRPRSISDDGSRVFFSSPDELAAGATEGTHNVYEWDKGQVYLLVAGEEGVARDLTEYADSSASGKDVFVVTKTKLAPRDFDNTTDLYDLRTPHVPGENVGPEAAPPTPTPCEPLADQCQGEAAVQPIFDAPSASEFFSGPGNLPAPPKQPVHKKKSVHKKPVHKKKRTHKKKPAGKKGIHKSRGKRATANHGRASR